MIYCPRTFTHPPTVEALDATGRPWEPVDLTDTYTYVDYWKERWAEGETFTSVEHDTIITADQIGQLEDCPEEWCCFDVDVFIPAAQSLNLVRFRDSFIAKYPAMWEGYWTKRLIGEVPHARWMEPAWYFCDTWLYFRMGRVPHMHTPAVVNSRPGEHSWVEVIDQVVMTQLVMDGMAGDPPCRLYPPDAIGVR